MDVIGTLDERNAAYAEVGISPDLKLMPSLKLTIVGCVDPRVDPFDIFGLKPGEAAVIRNVGGRIVPATFLTMAMLRTVTVANGGELGTGWNLIVLHHTDCGINSLARSPEMLAKYFGASPEDVEGFAISDPRKAVEIDIAALKGNQDLPAALTVTGMVYDVHTGRVDICVPPSQLRP